MKTVICMALAWWLWASWDSQWMFALRYGVPTANVFIQPQPHDCEWASAPLGNKHCHYDKAVSVVQVKEFGESRVSYVSYDEGKTWVRNGAGFEPSVSVSWTKVEE